jgi:uncharacterized protein YhdP
MGRIALEHGSVVLDGHALTLELTAVQDAGIYQSHLGVGIEDEVPMDWVLEHWPPDVIDAVHDWIAENVSGATLGPADLAVDGRVRTGEEPTFELDQLAMNFPFTGVDVQILSPDLVLEDVAGKASFNEESLDFEVERGGLRDLTIETGSVSIYDLKGDVPIAIDATFAGPVETVIEALTSEPLSLFSTELVHGLSGSSNNELNLVFPLGGEGKLTADDLQIAATGKLSGVAWRASPIDRDLDHGELNFEYRKEQLSVHGNIDAAGVPTRLDFRTDLAQTPPPIDVDVRSRIDEAGARALGMPQQSFLSGALDVEASFRERGDSRTLNVTADLKELVAEVEPLGWNKPAEAPGSASLEGHSTAGAGWELEDIEIESAGLKASGRIALTADPMSLSRAELSELRVGNSNVNGELTRTDPNAWRAKIAGPLFDAEPLIGYVKKTFGSKKEQTEPTGADDPGSLLEIEIDSFRYFLPIVGELRINGLDTRYAHYLASKISDLTGVALTLSQPQNHTTSTKPHTPRQLDLPW